MPKTKAEKSNQNQSTATSATRCTQASEVTPCAIPSITNTNFHRNWSWSDFLDSDSDMDMDHEVKSEGLDEHDDAVSSGSIMTTEKVEPKQMDECKDRRIEDDLPGRDGKTYFTPKAEQSARQKKMLKKLKKLRRKEKLDTANADKTEMRNKIPKLSKSLKSQDNHQKQTIPQTTIQATVSSCNKIPVAPVSQDFIIDSGTPSPSLTSSSKVHSNNTAVEPAGETGDDDDVKIVYSSLDSWRPWVVEMGPASSTQAPAVGTSEFAFEEFAQQKASSVHRAGPSQMPSVPYAHPQSTPLSFQVDNILQPSFGQAAITARIQEFYRSWNPNPSSSSITSDASRVQNDLNLNNTATITDAPAPVPSPTVSLMSDAGSHSTQTSSSVTSSGNGFPDRKGRRGSRKRLPEESVRKLKEYYQDKKYVTNYKELAATAGLTPTQVRVWFANRRVQDRNTQRRKVLSQETLEEPAKKTSRMKTNTFKQLEGAAKSSPPLENSVSTPSQSWQPQILTPPVTPAPSGTITPASTTSSVPPQSHSSTSSNPVTNDGEASAPVVPSLPATVKVFSLSHGPQAPFSPEDCYPPTVHKWTPLQQVFPAPSPSARTSRQNPDPAPIPDPKHQDKKKDNNNNSNEDEDVVEIDPLAMDDYFLPKNCITL